MVVLRAIGRFFARIGRWIRDTAWVQPLLIVGGIFAIIFSIKPISQAIQRAQSSGDEAVSFYRSYQLSLSGADNNASSAADRLINQIEGKEGAGDDLIKNKKFFLCFVKEDCSNCKEAYQGYLKLRDNWNNGEVWKIDDGKSFKMYTIFIDEKNSDSKLLIDDFLRNHINFFSGVNNNFIEDVDSSSYSYYNNISDSSKTSYKTNLNDIADTIGATEEEEAKGFVTPTTYLVDLEAGTGYNAVTECFFNYTSDVATAYNESNDYTKGYCLRDCWNNKDKSIWSKTYSK